MMHIWSRSTLEAYTKILNEESNGAYPDPKNVYHIDGPENLHQRLTSLSGSHNNLGIQVVLN